MRFKPYRPNSIVTPEMLQGRTDELAFIQQSQLQTPYADHLKIIVRKRAMSVKM